MSISVSHLIASVHPPPITEVRGWASARVDDGRRLIDLCQAVPDYPPSEELTGHLCSLIHEPQLARYSPDEGLAEVRGALCGYYRDKYRARITPENLCLTVGASQAFWLALLTLCVAGDEVILQSPYYFDHPMALDMLGIQKVCAPYVEEEGGIANPATLEKLITEKTRAIVVVTPGNPTGSIVPGRTIGELYNLARRYGIALILDETYNEFIPGGGSPHDLFSDPDWGEHFIHIASFGKTYAITGYRAGLLASSSSFVNHALKAQDTMVVCQPRIAQHAVKFGVESLGGWVAEKREMMCRRHDLFRREFTAPGNPFHLAASGAFFAWVRHPFTGCSGREVAKRLVDEEALMTLPGEVFGPGLEGYLRLAFGNIREDAITEAVRRFRGARLPEKQVMG